MSMPISRRGLLAAAAAVPAAAALPGVATAAPRTRVPAAVQELEERIRAAMEAYSIPGVSYGLRWRGHDYVGGLGITNLDDPRPVDADTVFRVGSTTKTFTGTAVMRLVERGKIDLDRTVRSYLPGFRTADETASRRVTVRQILNHSAGWVGDFFLDTGEGDDALARYVAGMSELPQLTPPGTVFAYNNAATSLAGHLIAVVSGHTYENVVESLLLDPLGLDHSGFFLEDLPGVSVATSHVFTPEGELVASPEAFHVPRSLGPAGALISSARDQLRWARFHLGDGRVPGSGRRLLTPQSMRRMQSRPGPGGTLFVELDGVGVTWMLRPTAEGPKVVQHGGDWAGQHSGFMMVPERDFALTVLTNSDSGPVLTAELFGGDWALGRFAGVHNLPARPRPLTPAQLAPYVGRFEALQFGFQGEPGVLPLDVTASDGGLDVQFAGQPYARFEFYRRDYVVVLDPEGGDTHSRANFERGRDGSVEWLRLGGRLFRHTDAATTRRAVPAVKPRLSTLPYPGE